MTNSDPDLPALVARMRAGDRAATEILARRAGDAALRTAFAALAGHDDARDIAQLVVVDVIEGIGRLREPERFDAWAHRIAANRTLQALRRRRRGRREVHLDQADAERRVHHDAAARADASRARAALGRALADLPHRQRVAVALRYVHDLSEADVAAALGVRQGTASSLLSRARATLAADPAIAALRATPNGAD